MEAFTRLLPMVMIELDRLSDWRQDALKDEVTTLVRDTRHLPVAADLLDSLHLEPADIAARTPQELVKQISEFWTPSDVYFAWSLVSGYGRWTRADLQIRTWATMHGIPVGRRGRISQTLRALYLQHSGGESTRPTVKDGPVEVS